MPNKEIIKEWVAALRSGEYEQARGALKEYREFDPSRGEFGEYVNLEKGRFCCLGVLCDLAERKGIVKGKPDVLGSTVMFDGTGGLPPLSVENWAGIPAWEVTMPDGLAQPQVEPEPCSDDGCQVCEPAPWLPPQKRIGLATLNDNHEWNFNEIADIIEKEWLVDA